MDGLPIDKLKELLSLLKKEITREEEPSDLKEIISQSVFEDIAYPIDSIEDRIKGAIIGRFAGCLLGVPVENYSIERMEEIAKEGGTSFSPTEY